MTAIGLINFNHASEDGQITWADMGTSDLRPNYGDMLVCAAILRHLDPAARTVRTKFGNAVPDDVDIAVIRGSTYLNPAFDYAAAIKTLESIRVPVAMVGLGVQFRRQDVSILDDIPDARRFVALLAEKSVSISVRGDYTAAVMTRLGARNLRVTGCPSLFYSRRIPQVRLPALLGTPQQRLGVSLHTGLRNSMYCRDATQARAKHVAALRYAVTHCAQAAFFEQGVKMEFDVADQRLSIARRNAAATSVIERLGGGDEISPDDLIARIISPCNVDDWLMSVGKLDATIGFRLHGNMAGLLQSIPCFHWTYDSRIKEFCDLYKLPHQDIGDIWVDPVDAMLAHDWHSANDAFTTCYQTLRTFYDENGVPHCLPSTDNAI